MPSVGELLISRDTWRQEVFTVHHLPGADFMEMRRLEADLEGEAPRYVARRTCFSLSSLNNAYSAPFHDDHS